MNAHTPKIVRATAGSLFRLPVVSVPELADSAGALQTRGVEVFATDMGGESLPAIPQNVLAQPTAWIFGGHTLWTWLLSRLLISLPQYGRVEPLNISTAAAVCLYQSAFSMKSVDA